MSLPLVVGEISPRSWAGCLDVCQTDLRTWPMGAGCYEPTSKTRNHVPSDTLNGGLRTCRSIPHPSRSSVSRFGMTAATCPTDIRRHLPYIPNSQEQISPPRGRGSYRIKRASASCSEDADGSGRRCFAPSLDAGPISPPCWIQIASRLEVRIA